MIKFLKENTTFTFIFLIAVIIRFIPAFNYQYSFDELCGLRNSAFTNWHDLINYGVKTDTHPILVQLIINATVRVFGYTEFWIKLPFLLFSLAAILYAYLFSLKWYGKTAALITASIFSFSYIFLFYAPLARMYSGGLFFSTALTYYFFEICFSENKRTKHYVLFVVYSLLCALNNHLSCLFAFTVAFSGLFFQDKKTLVKYVLACVCSVLLYLPHLPITITQLSQWGIGHAQDGWLPVPDKFVLFGFLKTLFGTGYVWIWFCVLVLAAFAFAMEMRVNKKTILLLVLFFTNYVIIHVYSVYKAPIFQYSVMLFSAPCFIWVATSIIKFRNKTALFIVFVCNGLLIYQSVFKKDFFENAVLNQNGFQGAQYCKLEDKYGKGKVEAYFMASEHFFIVQEELKHKRKFKYFLGKDFENISDFKKQIKKSKADFIILSEPSHIQLEVAKESFPFLTNSKQTLNVNYYLLSKSNVSNKGSYESFSDVSTDVKPKLYNYTINKKRLRVKHVYYKIDSLYEFSFSAYSDLRKFNLKEGNVIFAKVKINSTEPLNDVGFNFNVTNLNGAQLFFGGTDIGQFYTSDSTGYYAYSEMFVGSDFKKWQREDAKFAFFIWNRGKKRFLISGFEIKTIDYWPARWSWWD